MDFNFEIEVTPDRILASKPSDLALKNGINCVDECP
jgi:hypothetical protein